MTRSVRAVALPAAMLTLASHLALAQSAAPVAQQFEKLHFRSIGPAIMSGRIADLAVYEKNPAIWYVGTAHGGVWKTTSNGATFTPLLQDTACSSIGDVAVSQSNPDIVWVGTGEANNRQTHLVGRRAVQVDRRRQDVRERRARDSKHINRIVIDPSNNDVVLVAAAGSLFGPGGDRGVYKTTDGGKTWKRVLFVDDETGANDLVMSYTDPKTIYASTYQRRRTACCVNGGGPGSGSGNRPTAATPGRASRADCRAARSAASVSTPIARTATSSTPRSRRRDRRAVAVVVAPKRLTRRLRAVVPPVVVGVAAAAVPPAAAVPVQRTPARAALSIRRRRPDVAQGELDQSAPAVLQPGARRSEQSRSHLPGRREDVAHDRRRQNHRRPGVARRARRRARDLDRSEQLRSHDHRRRRRRERVVRRRKTWNFFANLPVGLFYHVGYDMAYPFNVCGGMQDNYDWCGPSASRFSNGIMNSRLVPDPGRRRLRRDPRQARLALDLQRDAGRQHHPPEQDHRRVEEIRPNPLNVTPTPKTGETFRWEWDTPMIFSPNDPGSLIVAANRVFESHDRGDSWTVISPDLTIECQSRHDRHDGAQGRRHPHLARRRHRRSGRRSSRSPSRRSRPACTTRAPTTAW